MNIDAENKRYYWNKLPFDFWERPTTRAILNMNNGAAIIILFQMMVKESAQRDGYLKFTDSEPYTAETLTLFGFSLEICTSALVVLQRFNFINILDDGTIFIVDIEEFVGSKSIWAEKKKQQRDKKKPSKKPEKDKKGTMSPECPDNVPEMSSKCPTDIDIERDKEKETETDSEKERDVRPARSTPTIKQIEEYITTHNKQVDPGTFFSYYSANGWKGSRGIDMSRNWESFVDLWDARARSGSAGGNLSRVTDRPERIGYQRDRNGVLYMSKKDYDMTRDDSIELLTEGNP